MFQFPANPVINQLFSPIPGLTYQFNGTGWAPIRSQSIPLTVLDTQFTLQDNVDPTKQSQFDNSLITPANTRVLQIPDSDGVIALNSQLGSFRNKIIGGDFSTNPWQRGTAVGLLSPGQYIADRWQYAIAGSTAVLSASRQTFTPTVAQAGRLVTNSLLVLTGTPDVTVDAGDVIALLHTIEGYNFMALAQRPMVLTFWHAHTKTGTYCVSFRNGATDRSCVLEYTQAVANAWEFSKLVVPASIVSGTWNYTNGAGLIIGFALMCGASFQTTPGTWQTGNFFATANQVNAVDAANNFYLALVQLETGTSPTPFEDRSFGTELMLCQRYCHRRVSSGANSLILPGMSYGASLQFYFDRFSVPMRVPPAFLVSTSADFAILTSAGNLGPASFTSNKTDENGATLTTANGGITLGQAIMLIAANSNAFMQYSAEF